jgi:hypothetical protein
VNFLFGDILEIICSQNCIWDYPRSLAGNLDGDGGGRRRFGATRMLLGVM